MVDRNDPETKWLLSSVFHCFASSFALIGVIQFIQVFSFAPLNTNRRATSVFVKVLAVKILHVAKPFFNSLMTIVYENVEQHADMKASYRLKVTNKCIILLMRI